MQFIVYSAVRSENCLLLLFFRGVRYEGFQLWGIKQLKIDISAVIYSKEMSKRGYFYEICCNNVSIFDCYFVEHKGDYWKIFELLGLSPLLSLFEE
jgi:hypothetical protein